MVTVNIKVLTGGGGPVGIESLELDLLVATRPLDTFVVRPQFFARLGEDRCPYELKNDDTIIQPVVLQIKRSLIHFNSHFLDKIFIWPYPV